MYNIDINGLEKGIENVADEANILLNNSQINRNGIDIGQEGGRGSGIQVYTGKIEIADSSFDGNQYVVNILNVAGISAEVTLVNTIISGGYVNVASPW